jgi:copper homeostasis protein
VPKSLGGITLKNVQKLLKETKAKEFHVSARSEFPSLMEYRNNGCFMGGLLRESEYIRKIVDSKKVSSFISSSNTL